MKAEHSHNSTDKANVDKGTPLTTVAGVTVFVVHKNTIKRIEQVCTFPFSELPCQLWFAEDCPAAP